MPGTDPARDEHEPCEVVLQWLRGPYEPLLPEALAKTRTHPVSGELDGTAIQADLMDRHAKVRVGLIDRQPHRQPEEAADLSIGGEWCAVIHELSSHGCVDHPLIDAALGVDGALELGEADVARIVNVAILW